MTTFVNRPKAYITRQIPQKGLDLLLERCNVSFWDSADPAPRTELLVNIPGITILVCMPTDKIDREILNAAGRSLKIVATMSEDCDHIEVSECTRRDIRILTLPQVTNETVTQMTIALLRLTTVEMMGPSSRNLNTVLQSKNIVKETVADYDYCLELSNRTIGIIGLESLGLTVGLTLKDMGVSSFLYHDFSEVDGAEKINAKLVDKNELLKKSDLIFVCSNIDRSGTSSYIFDRESFKEMKSSAVLIDATKGLFANFIDLYEALRNGEIAAAGLDIREYDVIPNRHPLDALENCFFLPFRESYKWDGRRKCSGELANAILSTLQDIEFSEKKLSTKEQQCTQMLQNVPQSNLPIGV
ncbi:hypothetical protein ACF0H5_019288 [Mactra antiquata]